MSTFHDATYIELKVIRPITKTVMKKEKTPDGIVDVPYEKTVKELRVKHMFTKIELLPLTQVLTERNKIAKRRCVVFSNRTQQYYLVDHSYESLKEMILDKQPVTGIGFKR